MPEPIYSIPESQYSYPYTGMRPRSGYRKFKPLVESERATFGQDQADMFGRGQNKPAKVRLPTQRVNTDPLLSSPTGQPPMAERADMAGIPSMGGAPGGFGTDLGGLGSLNSYSGAGLTSNVPFGRGSGEISGGVFWPTFPYWGYGWRF